MTARPPHRERGPGDGDYAGAEHDARWRRLIWPEDYENPKAARRYNLVVIGAGPGGLVTAIAAANLGARVALVERRAMGGDCLNVGCVPSKALLAATRRAGAGFDDAFSWLREVRAAIAVHDSVRRFAAAGVDVFLGEAAFEARDAVRVAGQILRARRFVVATGSTPSIPALPGLQEARALTNETVFDLRAQPRRLAVLGGGAVGCELAQGFARLGTEVHLFERAERVLPAEAPAASDVLARHLAADGVHLHTACDVSVVERRGAEAYIVAGGRRTPADQVLIALGRRANTAALNLPAAGVELDAAGRIRIDAKLRTSNARIFAIGDVASEHAYTHNADMQARAVVQNALFLPTARVDRAVIPRCTYTLPEVAALGRQAARLEADGIAYDRYRVAFADLDRGRAQCDRDGYAEVLTERGTDRILGATIVGHDAGEHLAPLVLLLDRGLGLGAAARLVLPYPTRSEYLKRLGDAYNRTRLTPRVAAILRAWLAWRR